MKKFFLLIYILTHIISFSEEQIFLKVIKKEIKNQKSKIKINNLRKSNLLIEEYNLYKNGEIIRKYDSEGEDNNKIDYTVGTYNFVELKRLVKKILEEDSSELEQLKVSFLNIKKQDNDVFSSIETPLENLMISISINNENKYDINSLYKINYKENEIVLANDIQIYRSENIKELIKFLNENLKVNVIWYENFKRLN